MKPAEEIRLIAGAKHGDHSAFEALVERYMGSAVAVARNYTANRDDALDLVVRRAEAAGGTVIQAPEDVPWGRRAVLADPDGRAVEINRA